jgi:hypothetical protein
MKGGLQADGSQNRTFRIVQRCSHSK